jgi:hypothetical protein
VIRHKIYYDEINYGLLKEAILAKARKILYVACDPTSMNIVAKKCVQSRLMCLGSIQRFLKRDLKPLLFNNKNVVGFGIKYTMRHGFMHFYGFPHQEIEDQVLVFQITTHHGRIIREFWLKGQPLDTDLTDTESAKELITEDKRALSNDVAKSDVIINTDQGNSTFRIVRS